MSSEITAVVLTYNEEEQIRGLLRNLGWCYDTILVDGGSTDKTRTIAREQGTTIIDEPDDGKGSISFDHHRARGVEAAETDWILSIDADERIPDALRQELICHLAQEEPEQIVEAPRANYLDEKRLRGSGQWPDYQPILFTQDAITFSKAPHAFANYRTNRVRQLPADTNLAIQHQFADSVLDHWRAQRRYAKIGGQHRRFKFRHLLSPPYAFYERFVKGRGYKDGLVGIGLSFVWAWYQAETTLRAAMSNLSK